MANTNLTQIQQTLALNGSELVYLIRQDPITGLWSDYVCTVDTLAGFYSGTGTSTPSMRQIKAAMAQQDVMLEVTQNLPADETSAYNIAWTSAFRMGISDPFVIGFLEPLLGQSEVNTIWALAPSFPV